MFHLKLFEEQSEFLTFPGKTISNLGDPFEGEVCLCWEIPRDMSMSVPTLQREKRREFVHGLGIGKMESIFDSFSNSFESFLFA